MEIVSRLSAKNLLRCKCVSKSCKSLISDPSFVRIRHQRSRCILGFLVQEFKECGGNVSGGDFFLYARVNRELGIYNWMDKSFPQSTSVVMASCDGLICYRSRRTRHVEVPEIVVWTQWPRNGLPWDPLTVMLVTSLDWLSTHLVLLQRWSPVLKWSAFSIQNMTQIPSPLWSTHRRQGNGKLHLKFAIARMSFTRTNIFMLMKGFTGWGAIRTLSLLRWMRSYLEPLQYQVLSGSMEM